jgi:uncharacterized protein
MLKKTLASLLLAGSLLSLGACGNNQPQVIAVAAPTELEKPGSFVVQGTATLEVAPDCADLTMTISADGARPDIATQAVQEKQQQMIAALQKLGVETPDVKLSYLSLEPIWLHDKDGWSPLHVGTYRAQVTITATTRKFDQIGAIMEAGANAGATSMTSQFRRSDLPELKKKVREMAIAAAREKASSTARALGIELGRIVSVAESASGSLYNSPYFPVANAAQSMPSATLGGTLQPLTLEITIGYELAKKA